MTEVDTVTIEKPRNVADSPFKSAKWDEITEGREFRPSDAPVLALLCSWYEVVDKCMDDIDVGGEVQVAYSNDMGDIKALPQLSTMKQASAEIRALNKQLGIDDESRPQKTEARVIPLNVIQQNRKSRAANAGGAG